MWEKEVEKLYLELIQVLNDEKIVYNEETLKTAIDYALKIYTDSKRYKGETTFSHAMHVAQIVAKLKIGIEAVYAAVLHEVPKFDNYNYDNLKELMGEEIANLVKDASKLYLLNYDGQESVEAENLRKMFMAIAKDIRVVINLQIDYIICVIYMKSLWIFKLRKLMRQYKYMHRLLIDLE